MKKTALTFIIPILLVAAALCSTVSQGSYTVFAAAEKMKNPRPGGFNSDETPRNSEAGKQMRIGAFADRLLQWEDSTKIAYNRRIRVAVVDTWVDTSHPFFANCINVPDGYLKEVSNPSDIEHGTHVAGIIANCAAPFVTVVPFIVDFINDSDSMTTTAALKKTLKDVIEYSSTYEKIDIINISLAYGAKNSDIDALRDVISEALNQGILIVVAAGSGKNNEGNASLYTEEVIPACFGNMPGVITVNSANNDGKINSGNNKGEEISLCAFGESVTSAIPNKMVADGSGTSMAAAYISAAAALLKFEEPWLFPEELENKLIDMAVYPSHYQGNTGSYGAGIFQFPKHYEEKPYIPITEGNLFRPSDFVTNLEVAEMLFNLLANQNTDYFSDIKFFDGNYNNKQTAKILDFVSGNGYMSGDDKGCFRGDESITRGEVAAVISAVNGYEKNYYGVEICSLYDDIEGHWAKNYIYLVSVNGAMSGTGYRVFEPNAYVTRAEITETFNRVFRRTINPLGKFGFADVPADHWAYLYIMNAAAPQR